MLASDPIFDSVARPTVGPLLDRFGFMGSATEHSLVTGAFVAHCLSEVLASECSSTRLGVWMRGLAVGRAGPLLDNLVYMEYANDSSTPCALFASKASKLPIGSRLTSNQHQYQYHY